MIENHFDFSNNYILENKVVRISPLKLHHIEELKRISDDDEIWTYFLEKGKGGELIKKYCLEAIHNFEIRKEYPFVIFDKRNNKYAGMTRLYDYNNELGIIKMGHTWYGKEFWGTKLNKHCKYLLFEFIFDGLGFERIGFGVHGQNLRSVNALKRIGCKQEGILRNFLPSLYDTSRVDILLFSVLKKEWNTSVRSNLELMLC